MNEQEAVDISIEIVDEVIFITLAGETMCTSVILKSEEALRLSSKLFQLAIEINMRNKQKTS